MKNKTWTSAFLIVITLAVYWQVSGHEFVSYDDRKYVTENPHVRDGLTRESISWAFTSTRASNWHPVTWLSHMLDVEWFGLDSAGHHLMNLFFHVTNAVLLFLLLSRMTGANRQSAFVAALFAIHPLHVESVAWVAERKDVLSGFFWMLTLMFYYAYVRRPGLKWYLFTLCAFILGLMSKPILVTLPFVMLLIDYWPLGRFRPGRGAARSWGDADIANREIPLMRLLLEKVPFFVLSLASSMITLYAQRSGGAMASFDRVPFEFRVMNMLSAYSGYMVKMFWPFELAVIYPLAPSWTLWPGILAAPLLAGITALTIRSAKGHPYLLVGWLWYLGTLVPVIGLVQVGMQSMADRYTYLPLIGLFIMVAWGVPNVIGDRACRRTVLSAAAGASLLALTICTWVQVGYWKNSVTLFGHAAEVVPDNYMAHQNLGNNLMEAGRFDEAVTQYAEVLRVLPDNTEALDGMGHAFTNQGKIEEAINLYYNALRRNPANYDIHMGMGVLLGEEGKLTESAGHFSEALRIKPDSAEAHYNLGVALARQERLEEGIWHFSEALRIKPDFKEARANLNTAIRLRKQSPSK